MNVPARPSLAQEAALCPARARPRRAHLVGIDGFGVQGCRVLGHVVCPRDPSAVGESAASSVCPEDTMTGSYITPATAGTGTPPAAQWFTITPAVFRVHLVHAGHVRVSTAMARQTRSSRVRKAHGLESPILAEKTAQGPGRAALLCGPALLLSRGCAALSSISPERGDWARGERVPARSSGKP